VPYKFSAGFYQTFKQALIPTFHKLLHEKKGKEYCWTHSRKLSVTFTSKLDKDTTKKENYRAISLMNLDIKKLNKTFGNQIQQHIKKITHHNQVSFIPGMEGWYKIHKSLNVIQHIDGSKDKNHIITSMNAEKT
jgi:hypothetical protein